MANRYRGGIISATPPTTTAGRAGVAKGMWSMQDQSQILKAGLWPSSPAAPTAPTSVSASANINLGATVSFTAPVDTGLGPITGYVVTSSPGGITASGSSSPIQITGLTAGVSYTFTVAALNAYGTGDQSAASNSVSAMIMGAQLYSSPGTYSWIVPDGVTSISAVVVAGGGSGQSRNDGGGGAGGGGGGLAYVNNRSVTPGDTVTVVVGAGANPVWGSGSQTGGTSSVQHSGTFIARAYGGGSSGGYPINGSGGNGGNPGGSGYDACSGNMYGGGGGGAGGYGYTGGAGSNGTERNSGGQGDPSGGGGGGGASGGYLFIGGNYAYCYSGGGGGGGTGLYGLGAQGSGGNYSGQIAFGGGGGSNGNPGSSAVAQQYGGTAGSGGWPGGGGGGNGTNGNNNCSAYAGTAAPGAAGGVRIVYPGNSRTFPSNNVGA